MRPPENRAPQEGTLSGIILAGGASKRMGTDKAALRLGGKTLLEHQAEKLKLLGIQDILLSGTHCPALPGTRVIADIFPLRGPLGGLHACLNAAQNPRCLVITVDMPLIPVSTLAELCRAHTGPITILSHAGRIEPLIGVYDRCVTDCISLLIAEGGCPARSLLNCVPWTRFEYFGSENFLTNCNTPEDFRTVESFIT